MGSLEPVLGSLAPRLHMLLLWLSLLLWTGSCWELHGKRSPGSYFETADDKQKDITGFEVYISIFGIIRGFKLRFGSTWSEVYCKKALSSKKMMLNQGENVVTVRGDFRLYILRLIFVTNKGREIVFGYRTGYQFESQPDESGKVLTGLCGKCFVLGMQNACFKWDYPVEGAPPPEPKLPELPGQPEPPDPTITQR